MKPEFKPGKNIAVKVPACEFEETVHFYEQVLGLKKKEAKPSPAYDSIGFEFGDKTLWIDSTKKVDKAEIWLEITTTDVKAAEKYFADQGCIFQNTIEKLPDDLKALRIRSPSKLIHLVADF